MKKIVVTGATGFVGANLVSHLVSLGHQVHVLNRFRKTAWRLKQIKSDLNFHYLSLLDHENLLKTLKRIKPDWIFHLAAHGAYSYQIDYRAMIEANYLAFVNLIEAGLKVGTESIVHTGSSSEYGFKDIAPSEKDSIDPNSYYAATKAAATIFGRFSALEHKINIVTLRLYSVYGPYEEPTRLMPSLILHGLQKKLPSLVDPSISRDFIYVADVCRACVAAAENKSQPLGGIYNIGTGQQTTLADLVSLISQKLEIGLEPQWGSMPNRHWDTNTWVSNPGAAKKYLRWQAKYSLSQGIDEMINWFRQEEESTGLYHRQLFK